MEELKTKTTASPKSIFEEVVLTYSSGNYKAATNLILGAVLESSKVKNKDLSDKSKKQWLLALDMFQATKNSEYFNKLSLFYSKYFSVTPPVFDEYISYAKKRNHEYIGRSNLNIDIKISEINISKIEDFEIATISNKSGLINFSRSSIIPEEEGTEEKIFLLRNAMRNIRESNVSCVIMGETDFILKIENIVLELEKKYKGKEFEIPKTSIVYWLFLCEIYQWLGYKEKFEALSLKYSNIFNITPPAFNEQQTMSQYEKKEENDFFDFNKKTQTLTFYGSLNSLDAEKFINILSTHIDKIKNNDHTTNITIDLNYVTNIDYMLATQLALFLSKEFDSENNNNEKIKKSNIIIKNPFEFIIRLFDITGVSSYITYKERNRNKNIMKNKE